MPNGQVDEDAEMTAIVNTVSNSLEKVSNAYAVIAVDVKQTHEWKIAHALVGAFCHALNTVIKDVLELKSKER